VVARSPTLRDVARAAEYPFRPSPKCSTDGLPTTLETSTSGGHVTHARFCGQNVGTASPGDSLTSFSILFELAQSVWSTLHAIGLSARASSGKPLTTAVPTSEKERDGTKRNGPDRDRPRRTSIWPKMAVTVGFEPKKARSSSIRLGRIPAGFRGFMPSGIWWRSFWISPDPVQLWAGCGHAMRRHRTSPGGRPPDIVELQG
jgi:hypothetical protein